jgi:hypothetical protein
MQRTELLLWLGQGKDYLSEDQIDWLEYAANRLEDLRRHPSQLEDRGRFLIAMTDCLIKATQQSRRETNPDARQGILDAGMARAGSYLALAESDPSASITFHKNPKQDNHYLSGNQPDPREVETTVNGAAAHLHATLASVVKHGMNDHGTTAWWECYEARSVVAATAAAFVAAMATLNLLDAK